MQGDADRKGVGRRSRAGTGRSEMLGNEASKSCVPWPRCGGHWNSLEQLNHPHVSARALWSEAWSEEVDSHEIPVSKRETFQQKTCRHNPLRGISACLRHMRNNLPMGVTRRS